MMLNMLANGDQRSRNSGVGQTEALAYRQLVAQEKAENQHTIKKRDM